MSEQDARNPLDQSATSGPVTPSADAPVTPVVTPPPPPPAQPHPTGGQQFPGAGPQYSAMPQPQPAGYAYGQGVPPAPLAPETEKQVGALAHGVSAAATFFSGGLLGLVAAIALWVLYKDRGPFVREHVRNALNLQITLAIGLAVSIPLMFVLIGFVTYPVIWVVGLTLHIVGVVKALNGEWWRPPMTLELVR